MSREEITTQEQSRVPAQHIVAELRAIRSALMDARSARDRSGIDALLARLLALQSSSSTQGYPSFHIVCAEAYIASGDSQRAKQALRTALRLSPNSARPAILLEALGGELAEGSTPSSQPRSSQPGSNQDTVDRVSPAVQPAAPSAQTSNLTLGTLFEMSRALRSGAEVQSANPLSAEVHSAPREPVAEPFDLEKIANELTRDRPIVRPGDTSEDVSQVTPLTASFAANTEQREEPALVSETLARILAKQGKLDEARKVYIQLARVEPERYEYFRTRIEEIDEALVKSK